MLLSAILMLCTAASWALSHERLDQLHHTAWTAEDGAPPEIRAMAQTHDGWLWLGSSAGLFRFDGRRFERVDVTPPGVVRSPSVATLAVMPDGDLWVGYVYGGASRLRGGSFTHYQPDSGLPNGPTLLHFELDGSQRLWAWTTRGWFLFEQERFVAPPASLALPSDVRSGLTDAHGTTWLLGRQAMYRLNKGAERIERIERVGESEESLVHASDGSVWIASPQAMTRLSESGPTRPWRPVSWSPEPYMLDRNGNLWTAFCEGICRSRPTAPIVDGASAVHFEKAQTFSRAEGLSGKIAMSTLEDREGNIWIGGKRGLDRFRHTHLVRVPTGDILYFAMAPAAGHGIWLGSTFNPLPDQPYQRSEGSTLIDMPGPKLRVTCQFRDSDGSVWVGGRAALWHQRDGRLTPVPVPESGPPRRVVQALARDAGGALWMSMQGDGVFRLHDGSWTRKGGHDRLPDVSSNVLVAGDDGALWFGYSNDGVYRLQDGQVRRWGVEEGLLSGPVTALHARDGVVLIGGALGLFALDGERFRRLHSEGRDVLQGITGIVLNRAGELWLNGLSGLVRVLPQALRRTLAPSREPMRHELFDSADGMPGVAQQVRPLPTLVEADDGRLWVAASEGLAWIDPTRLRRNPHAPAVRIHALRSDAGLAIDPQQVELPPNTDNVAIAYTALALGHPERARFRYRLEGFDRQWREAGTGREAHYTRLPPGRFRFQVVAANEDGVWNESGAQMAVQVRPAYYQTAWFRALVVVSMLALLWLAYRWRLRQLAARLQLRLDARIQERERIARDLHDTLLQSTQGLILNFQSIANQAGDTWPLRDRMERVLAQADAVLIEGRDRVAGLRAEPDGDAGELLKRLTTWPEQAEARTAPLISGHGTGPARALLPQAREELFAIGREAVLNALRHARAGRIDVSIDGDDHELRLRVQDDGCGIEPAVLGAGARPGHWGLPGMRERAGRLGGALDVRRHEGGGTEVLLRVPASRVYGAAPGPWRRWRAR